MSRDRETLLAIFEAFNRRDFDDALRYAHPDVELHPGLTELDVDECYYGREDVKRFMDTITHAWESYVVTPEEVVDAGAGRWVAVESWRARGRQGIEFEFTLFDVYTFRDGRLMRIDGFRDRAAAFAAAGARD